MATAKGIVAVFYDRIKKGKITIDDVPALWRDAVQALLDEDGAETSTSQQQPE